MELNLVDSWDDYKAVVKVEMMGLIAVELKEARKVGKKDYLMVV